MMNWVLALFVLVIPCYFGAMQVSELLKAARRGELKCPVRKRERLELSSEN
jgi:hypothetical protein